MDRIYERGAAVISEPVRLLSRDRIVLACALAAFTLCYASVAMTMVGIWSTQALYSYGFLVPIISAYITWIKAENAPALQRAPDYALGGVLVAIAMLLLVIGHIGSILTCELASLIVAFTGFLLLVFGRGVLKHYWFPIAYLLLMVPIWNVAIERLQDPSRVVSAGIASSLLNAFGVPVLLQGTRIVLPHHTLAVMRECSGVNQLVATIAMVLPVTYLWMIGSVRRIVLVALAVLVTYLSNGFRIALVGWFAYSGYGDGDLLGSYAHVSEGLVVALVGYVAIAGCFSALSRWPRRSTQGSTTVVPPRAVKPTTSRMLAQRRVWLDAGIISIMVVVGIARVFAVSRDVQLTRSLRELPATIGDWSVSDPGVNVPLTGVPRELVDAYPAGVPELRFIGVDDELTRTYRNAVGAELQLYVGFYRRQEDEKELTSDASDQLRLVGSPVVLTPGTGPTIGEVVTRTAGLERGMLFWYDINGRIISDIYKAKAYTILDGLTRRRTDGAVVMIAWRRAPGASPDQNQRWAREFAQGLIPILRNYLPR